MVDARDAEGRITHKSERVGKQHYTHSYAYDDRGRLTEANTTAFDLTLIFYEDYVIPVKTNKTSRTESFTYDANGNRLSKTIDGNTTTATHTIADQLETVGSDVYAYDEDGYLSSKITSEGTTHYSYGTLGELRSVVKPDGTVIEYLHNANNQRVAKKVNGTVTEKYLWANLTTLLAVYDGNDSLGTRFEYADNRMPYKMTYNGQAYYLSYDQVGTLRIVTNENGTIVKRIDYDTFGNVLLDSNPSMKVPFGFAGGLYDEATGLTRFGYRDYDAQTGKWTAKDPIGFNGGDTNLYGYVLGDPVGFIDPEGLDVWVENTTSIHGLHQRVCVNIPGGGKYCISFALDYNTDMDWKACWNSSNPSTNGEGHGYVYTDLATPTDSVAYSRKTSGAQDAKILALFQSEIGNSGYYNIFCYNCRDYSRYMFLRALDLVGL